MDTTTIGLTTRPYAGEQDVEAMAEIINAELKADGVPGHESAAEMLAWIRNPSESFSAARDLDFAEIDGRVVAFAERNWVDTTDGKREYRVNGAVLPEWRRHGIGQALLDLNEQRVRDLAASQETGNERVTGSWSNDRQAGRIALMRANGYQPVRWFFDMVRDLSEPIPEVPLPDGIEVRPVTEDQIRTIWKADTEAFKDHWGGFDDSEESYQRWIVRPDLDPSLWVVLFDGEQVAGASINAVSKEENEALGVNRGWLHSVFTTREYRRRGVARAAVARSLKLLKERGLDTGILGVDATNPTGALRVYEGVGFTVAERSTAWRKPFDAD